MTPKARESFDVRRARPTDLPALLAVERRAFRHPWSKEMLAAELGHAWSTVLVADAGACLGFAVYWVIQDEVHLLDVAVDPDHQRRGVASALLAGLLADAANKGASRVLLEVRRSNAGARALYRAHGFEVTGVRKRYYVPDREDAVLMERRL